MIFKYHFPLKKMRVRRYKNETHSLFLLPQVTSYIGGGEYYPLARNSINGRAIF